LRLSRRLCLFALSQLRLLQARVLTPLLPEIALSLTGSLSERGRESVCVRASVRAYVRVCVS